MQDQLLQQNIGILPSRNCDQPWKHLIGTGDDTDLLFSALGIQDRQGVDLLAL